MTRPGIVGSKLGSATVKSLLALLRRATFLQGADLARVMTDNTERLLNLPGTLPFFPTEVTELSRVHTLVSRLHPVHGGHPLVRIGSDADGGYVVPDDLAGIAACFSPGVSNVADFELDCATRGMNVFMADASVEGPPISHPRFCFTRKFIGARTTGDFVTLADWVHDTVGEGTSDLLLQMDIEGAEYEALLATPGTLLERFRIIVVEFHFLDRLFSAPVFPLYGQAFDKLLHTHRCVHIHPNNVCGTIRVRDLELPQMAEFTFLRNDRVADCSFATQFPHPLDRDNWPGPSIGLPKSCYRSS